VIRTAGAVLRAGALVTTVVVGLALIASAHAPLYDGVGFPDEPYRYLRSPAGQARTAPPATAHGELKFADGVNTEKGDFATSELGPQFKLYVPAKSIRACWLTQPGSVDRRSG